MDDILLMGSDFVLVSDLVAKLSVAFKIRDMGLPFFFLVLRLCLLLVACCCLRSGICWTF